MRDYKVIESKGSGSLMVDEMRGFGSENSFIDWLSDWYPDIGQLNWF